MTYDELVRRACLVSVGNSQMFDYLNTLSGIKAPVEQVTALRAKIKRLARAELSISNNQKLKQLRQRIRKIMLREDYLLVAMETKGDFKRMCAQPITFNGKSWRFLFATTGGVKESTMIFVLQDSYEQIVSWINCGRNEELPYIPAKLEAYMSLVCSASIAVSAPRGVLVVDDCVTRFFEDAIVISDAEDGGEPVLQYRPHAEIELIDSDGYGLMCPALAARWARELGEGDMISGANTRCAYEKGMLFTFDFHRFAEEVAHKYVVRDIWGVERDIRDVEVILTASMLKLWDAYSSWEAYWRACQSNGYTFRVTKVCPQELEEQRTTNYQFIQPYNLTDEQFNQLIEPTVGRLKRLVNSDWAEMLLYVTGEDASEKVWAKVTFDWRTALRISPAVANDPYVAGRIRQMLQTRIDEAKVGVLDVRGNYSIISGDPYSLCQHVFGLEVTGLLRAGQCYNRYWIDRGVERIVCFRAPMSVGNNIRILSISSTPEQQDWYQYMRTCTILNSWDATCHALNGADKDSDSVLTTDNALLVHCAPNKPVILCEQRKGAKKHVEWEDFAAANMAAAGNDIGSITNRVTAMYDVLTTIDDPDLRNILEYRIQCGQHFQQAAIDKIKGVVSQPMPRYWYDYHALKITPEDDEETCRRKERDLCLVTSKKPYFMRYIYADLMKEWRMYVQNANTHAMRMYRMKIAQLEQAVKQGEATPDQEDFLRRFHDRMPVSDGSCLVNRICRAIEDALGVKPDDAAPFDYSIYKTDMPVPLSAYDELRQLYREYISDTRSLARDISAKKLADGTFTMYKNVLIEYYREQCEEVVGNAEQLCNILIDICYGGSASKAFVWDICGEQIIRNLLKASDGRIYAIVRDAEGSMMYHGKRYTVKSIMAGDVAY